MTERHAGSIMNTIIIVKNTLCWADGLLSTMTSVPLTAMDAVPEIVDG